MRFRRGSRVEVFYHQRGALWCVAISGDYIGNGHTYSVRYYSFELSNNEAVEERVPRKIIRPCPPQIDVDRWEAGELVEVLDNISWKTATVLEELSGRYYVVRLLGAKVSCSVKSSTLTGSDEQQNLKPFLNSVVPQETSVASLRVLKRPSPCDSAESAESCTRSPKKIRSLEEDGHQHRFASSELRGVKMHVQASFNKNKSGFRQLVRMVLVKVPTLIVMMLNLQKKHLDAERKLRENIHYQVMEQRCWPFFPAMWNQLLYIVLLPEDSYNDCIDSRKEIMNSVAMSDDCRSFLLLEILL
ncbi:unnamed protein product [Arabidopsis arenosa]|uniref:Agenet domain-containing protein n=1 Tax=Arabidopsis arenosa TaxID=38785 RepID=A0A8S2A4M2_ARAAE|nr:unnamed protein product [Arabidopsis arenosa]